MNSISPVTLSTAADICASNLGLRWPDNRRRIVRYINDIRKTLYSLHPLMFGDVFHCFTPSLFRESCLNECRNRYLGITLPPDMEGVVEAWECGIPLKIRSRWRESFTGKVVCGGKMNLILMPQRFPTERDLHHTGQVSFYAESVEDEGKTVYVEVRDNRSPRVVKKGVTLKGDDVTVLNDVYEIVSVALPTGLCGRVKIFQDDYVLSEYAPWEEVPSYARVKVGSRCSANVFVQGTRKFVPVWFDHDIVECGDQMILQFMSTYVQYVHSKDGNERETAREALADASRMIDSALKRQLSGAIQDGLKHRMKPRCGLPGYGHRTYRHL